MAIIHTPRVIWSLLNGLRKHRARDVNNKAVLSAAQVAAGVDGTTTATTTKEAKTGLGLRVDDPHRYYARVGIFDVDYLGHMNNAAFLSHAEYARWDMTAENGLLQSMYRTDTHFMVASSYCRYRAEMRPIFQQFQVETYVAGLDDRNLWMYHAFRYVDNKDKGNNNTNTNDDKNNRNNPNTRTRAQIIAKGVMTHNRKVINPCQYLVDVVGIDSSIIHSLRISSSLSTSTSSLMMSKQEEERTDNDTSDNDTNDDDNTVNDDKFIQELLQRYENLETSTKGFASIDDDKVFKV